MIWLIRKIFLLLSSETSPVQLSAGIAFGIWLGMIPVSNLIWLGMFLLVLILRVNLSMFFTFLTVSKLMYLILYPLIAMVGNGILHAEFLKSLLTALYNTPVVALSKYNYPVVMGGWVLGLAFFVVLFPLGIQLIKLYRQHILQRIEKTWIMKLVHGSKFYKWYTGIVG